MAEFLLELVSEEIPPAMQEPAAENLKRLISEMFAAEGAQAVKCVQQFSTPRRIGVCFDAVPTERAAQDEERRGPKEGAPEKAVQGFRRSVGDAVISRRDGYYFATLAHPAMDMRARLGVLLPKLLRRFPWPKSMRWVENDDFRWVRPLRAILCLLDGEAVAFEVAGLKAGNESEGEAVASFEGYQKLMKQKNILIDPEARRQKIENFIRPEIEGKTKLIKLTEDIREVEEFTINDELIKAMAQISEYPILQKGSTTHKKDILPTEAIVQSIYAKEFCYMASVRGESFLMLIDGEKENHDGIKRGFDTVLQARINDADFFISGDIKTGLDELRKTLKVFSFHSRLGMMLEKADRIEKLAGGKTLNGDEMTKQAAHHAKTDIASLSGKEFPEALGAIGARLFYDTYPNLDEAQGRKIVSAIETHYLPQRADDALPTKEGQIIALADRADTLAGFFSIKETPTGSKDPFALRRTAIGMIRIILESTENDFQTLDLNDLFAEALDLYRDPNKTETLAALRQFITERLKYHLRNDYPPDQVAAAMANDLNLRRIKARLLALNAFLQNSDGAHLMTAFRRVSGILKGAAVNAPLDEARLSEPAERALAQKLTLAHYQKALAAHDFTQAFGLLADLRPSVDDFFNQVRVEVDDPQIRQNRYALCMRLKDIMLEAADFSAIAGT